MIDIHELYKIYQAHPEVSTDTRHLPEGCIFFALRGERFDGNAYALEALERGASYAVVDDASLPEHPQLLRVSDTLTALQELAALHRATLSLPLIAITGTNGKTTTKELAAAVLSQGYNLLYTQGNLNNHIGVPLTLLRMRPEHQLVLIEMGASHPGDIDELCQIAQPNYGLITNIGKAHLEGFGSIEGVASTKGELYDWLRAHEGKAIRRFEDEWLTELGEGIPAVLYGQSQEALVRGYAHPEPNSPLLTLQWEVPVLNIPKQTTHTKLVGAYNVDNVLAAIALGLFFAVPVEAINTALEGYTPSNSRSQLIKSEANSIIADAYNANPSSMRSAVDNFLSISTEQPRLLILGDMNELGEASRYAHKELLTHIRSQLRAEDTLWLCGPLWEALEVEGIPCWHNVQALKASLEQTPPRGKFILVKGSNSIGLNQILELL